MFAFLRNFSIAFMLDFFEHTNDLFGTDPFSVVIPFCIEEYFFPSRNIEVKRFDGE